MRDWIGTGVSLLGCVILLVVLVRIVRTRARRSSALSRSRPDRLPAVPHRLGDHFGSDQAAIAEAGKSAADLNSRHPLVELGGGLAVLESGQLIRAHGWLWAILHVLVIGLIAAGLLLLRRDLRSARRQP